MSKYIIEIEEEPYVRRCENALYRAKGFNSLVFDQFGLDKLTPLDKALDEAYQKGFEVGQHEATTLEYQQGLEEGKKQAKAQAHLDVCHDIERVAHGNYQKGLNDAWGTIIKIALIPYAERSEIFDGQQDILSIVQKFSPSEVAAKLREYERQKADAEIKVGDEVFVYGINGNVVVVEVDEDCVDLSDLRGWHSWYDRKNIKKTGRHFPQVAELFKAMKDEQRNCSTCKHQLVNSIECVDCCGYKKYEPKEGAE